jgi:methylamine dehydrogenase accessory protein MauD
VNELWIALDIAQWSIIVGLSFIVMGLVRQQGLILLRLGIDPGVLITKEGLERGASAPDFEAFAVQSGKVVRLSDFRGRRVALVFLSPTCVACRELVPHLNEIARSRQGQLQLVAVMNGGGATCAEFVRRFKVRIPLLVDSTNAIAQSYGVVATPFAFLIDEWGTILIRGVVNTWPHLEALLDEQGTFQHGEFPWKAEAADTQTSQASSAVAWQQFGPTTGNEPGSDARLPGFYERTTPTESIGGKQSE